MKKYSLICILLVTVLLFSSCGEIANNTNDIENNINNINNNIPVNNENVVQEDKDIIDVSYMAPKPIGSDKEANFRYIQNKILDKLGINIDISSIPGEDKPGVDLLVAGSSLPDCGWVYCCANSVAKSLEYFEGGAIRAIPIDKIIEFAPEYYSILQEDPTFDVLLTEEEDSYYALAAFRYGNTKLAWTIITRYDWMKNLGIAPKGEVTNLYDYLYITDEAYTVTEFSDLIYEFTYSDPDMNAENDTIGHLIYSNWIWDFAYIPTLCAAYDIRRDFSPMENGWGMTSDISPGAEKAYIQLSKWIEQKVVNLDPISFGLDVWLKRWETGVYGSMACFYRYFDREAEPPNNLVFNSPDAEILVLPPLIDDDGTGGRAIGYADFIATPDSGFFFINSKVQDEEKFNRIIEFFEWSTANYEGWLLTAYGEEGLHYNLDEKTNKRVLLTDQEMLELDPDLRMIQDDFAAPVFPKESEAYVEKYHKYLLQKYTAEHWEPESHSYIIAPVASVLNLKLEWFQRASRQAKTLAFNEFLDRVFEGSANIDVEWENLMAILDNLGLQEYLYEVNSKAYLYDEFIQGTKITPVEKFTVE